MIDLMDQEARTKLLAKISRAVANLGALGAEKDRQGGRQLGQRGPEAKE